jgi:hypothetical protein
MNNIVILAGILACERRYYSIITLVDDTDHHLEDSAIQSTAEMALASIYNAQPQQVKDISKRLVRPLRFRETSQREYLDDIARQAAKLC